VHNCTVETEGYETTMDRGFSIFLGIIALLLVGFYLWLTTSVIPWFGLRVLVNAWAGVTASMALSCLVFRKYPDYLIRKLF